jgi:hypothetical protein
MRPIAKAEPTDNPIDEALAWHDGDVRATIATLLADCAYLRYQIEVSDHAMSRGFTRGWRPQSDRD